MLFSFGRLSRAALLAALLTLSACSPTFNWRELRPEGTPLLALMPCKPDRATRRVPLTGALTDLHMHSCEAGGLRFALAWADVGEGEKQAQALAAWRRASLHAIRAAPGATDAATTDWSVAVAGASTVLGVATQGQDAQGRTVHTRMAYFTHGTQLFQAALYGASLPDAVVATYFEGLRLP